MTTRIRPDILRLGLVELDLGEGVVEHPEHSIALTRLETNLLAYLAERPSREVSRAELLANVWGYTSRTRTRTVDALIHRLRDKLGEPRGRPRYLLTVAGGYRLFPSPPSGREALCTELATLLHPGAIVTLVGPDAAGRSEVARYLAYRLDGFLLEIDLSETGSVRSALRLEGIERPSDFDRGGLWIVDGVGQLDIEERELLYSAAHSGALLMTARKASGLERERVVRLGDVEQVPAERQHKASARWAAAHSDRLTAEQRAVLEMAGVFRGAFLPSSLAAIVGHDIGSQLELLVSQGLLARHGAQHLELPPSVRILLADRPLDGEIIEHHRQLLVRRARADFWAPHCLRPELADLQAAFDASRQLLERSGVSAREDLVDLAQAIQRVHTIVWNEPRHDWLEERTLSVVDHPRLWMTAARREHDRSQPSAAWRCAERASAVATTAADRAEVELLFGLLEIWRSRAEVACSHLAHAQEAFAALGDRNFEAHALYLTALARSELDDMTGADRSMARARACVSRPSAFLESNLDLISANLDRKAGREEQAARVLEHTIATLVALDDMPGAIQARVVLVDVLLCVGELHRAFQIIQETMLCARQFDRLLFQLCLLCSLTELYLGTGRPQLAVLAARDASALSRHIQHEGVRLNCAGLLGLALLLAGEISEALQVLEAVTAKAQGDDGARHTATLAVARARAADPTAPDLVRDAERAAVHPSTRRWTAWCRSAVGPRGRDGCAATAPGPGVYDRIGVALMQWQE